MKRIAVFVMVLLFLLPANVFAKSFTVDRVQIKGWVQPNGDVLMNEVFTYSLDGEFKNLTRSFPEDHAKQIHNFDSYIINRAQPIVGELEESELTRALNKETGGTYKTAYNGGNETVSVLYVYTMQNAVTSYDTYSVLDITYFEDSFNHEEDLNDVTITYVLPDSVGTDSIHGFLHDRQGQVQSVYRDGISLHTPNSSAYTETATRVFFPSEIMKEQSKIAAPISFKEALQEERKRVDNMASKLSKIPGVVKLAEIGSVLFLVLIGLLILLKQRLFSVFGNANLVLQTDPTYLTLVDQNGKFNRKNFLSGLFSLVDKGIVRAELADVASRFQVNEDTLEKTLIFRLLQSNERLKKAKNDLLPHEQYLVTWLFKGRVGHRKFHLHDMAGPAEKEKRKDRLNVRRQIQFHKNHVDWHEDVLQLMTKAGALSTLLPKIIKTSIFALLALTTMFGFYTDNKSILEMVFFAIVVVVLYYFYHKNPTKKWPSISLFFATFFGATQITDLDLELAIMHMILVGAILFFVMPVAITSSITAFYTKMSISKFRRQVRRGIPEYLNTEEQERWLARAYVLNKSKKRLPKLRGSLPETSPLLPLFALQVDPLHFSYSTWGPMSSGSNSSSSGSSSDGGGYSGGGYSGGGDGGGGGAGAD